jgi:hypothetical protein
MYKAPTSPYEAAWQEWNYNGGASRGEPMPRIQDYPDTFEEDLSGGTMATDMGESVKQGKQMQSDYSDYAPSPASPDEVYGATMPTRPYAPMPAQPGLVSNVMGGAMGNAMARPGMARAALGGAMGNAMGRPGMANAMLGGAVGSAIRKNPGLLKRAAGGLMGAMTLGQLNRRKGY